MTVISPHEGELSIEGPLLSTRLPVDHRGRALSRTISIPPGVHVLTFRCTAPRVMAFGDWRELVFRVVDFRVEPATP